MNVNSFYKYIPEAKPDITNVTDGSYLQVGLVNKLNKIKIESACFFGCSCSRGDLGPKQSNDALKVFSIKTLEDLEATNEKITVSNRNTYARI